MHPEHLLTHIIRPTLEHLHMADERAEMMLLVTAAVESECGYYLKQLRGPALGVFQMEPNTHDDIWVNYLENRTGLRNRLENLLQRYRAPIAEQLVVNPMYACAMARIQYRRSPLPLPETRFDIDTAWDLYKIGYNSVLGSTEKDTFVGKWNRYIPELFQ